MTDIAKNTLRWIFLMLLQVGILNNIGLWGLLNPFIYIFFILMLPLATPRALLMLLAFGTGLIMDIASNTGGLHAAACTLLGFIRPFWVKAVFEKNKYIDIKNFRIEDIDTSSFLIYGALLIFFHHNLLYILEASDFSLLPYTLGKALINSIIALLMMLAFRFMSVRTEKSS